MITESKMYYDGAVPTKPGIGTILIQLPEEKEVVKNGIIIAQDTTESTHDERNWKRECLFIEREIRQDNDSQRRNQMNERELQEYIRKKLPPKPNPSTVLGADRWNLIHGTVLGLPSRIGKDKATKKTINCDLKVGDEVYFHYLALQNSSDWHDRGALAKDWATITYSSCFFAIRKGEIVMLNNYCLLEPIIEESFKSKYIITPDISKKESAQKAILRHAPQGSEVNDGDVVYFMKAANVRLEYEMISTFEKPLIRMKYDFLVAKEA